jgi:hypothetical protein
MTQAALDGVGLDELMARFEAASIPRGEWTHAAHLQVGACYVDRFGPSEALERLRAGIWRLNEANGVANTPTNGYHETVTAAYVQLIARFLGSCSPATSFPERVAAMLASPVAGKQALLRHYSRALLMSPRARVEWVPPDRLPLPVVSDATVVLAVAG